MGESDDTQRKHDEVRRAIQARDEFLRVAGHELKTPLAAIQLQLDGLVRLAQHDPPEPRRMAEKAERASASLRRLTRLIDELLDVSRLVTGRLQLSREPTDLAVTVRTIVGRHRSMAERAGCAVRMIADQPVRGSWDPTRVDQVVATLVENALTHGRGKPVEVSVTQTGKTARLVVADHGVGIAPEDQKRIFERFEDAIPQGTENALGIGLWIMRKVVEAHGGSIALESAVGQGARFTIELPTEPPR